MTTWTKSAPSLGGQFIYVLDGGRSVCRLRNAARGQRDANAIVAAPDAINALRMVADLLPHLTVRSDLPAAEWNGLDRLRQHVEAQVTSALEKVHGIGVAA